MRSVLQVFAKAPVPGTVKTRLVPPLDAESAAALHRALVERTLQMAASARPGIVDTIELWCAPDAAHPFFEQCARRFAVTLRQQCGADLGARMRHALADALARGNRPVLVGTDCPGLNAAGLAEAFHALRPGGADVVLLPTEDGGYALIGAARIDDLMFDGIAWGSDSVHAQTAAGISALVWTLHSMATGWDVDRPHDLERLRALEPRFFDTRAA